MYYLEIRYQESNKENAVISFKQAEKSIEIISYYASSYYICCRLNSPMSKQTYDDLKSNKLFYFISYYKI